MRAARGTGAASTRPQQLRPLDWGGWTIVEANPFLSSMHTTVTQILMALLTLSISISLSPISPERERFGRLVTLTTTQPVTQWTSTSLQRISASRCPLALLHQEPRYLSQHALARLH